LEICSKLEFFVREFYQAEGTPDKFISVFKMKHDWPFVPDPDAAQDVRFFSTEMLQNMINNWENFHPEFLFLLQKYFLPQKK